MDREREPVDERPRPHGDPLRDEVEGNAAQRQSDAPGADSSSVVTDRAGQGSDRENSRGSTANGVPAFDDDAGEKRRKQYDEGAGLVSGID
jgi:hypothetical protein